MTRGYHITRPAAFEGTAATAITRHPPRQPPRPHPRLIASNFSANAAGHRVGLPPSRVTHVHTTSALATHAPASSNRRWMNATWMFRRRISIVDRTDATAGRTFRPPFAPLFVRHCPTDPTTLPGRHRNPSIELTTTATPSFSFRALRAPDPPIASVRSRSNHRRTSASDAPLARPRLSSDSNSVTRVFVVDDPLGRSASASASPASSTDADARASHAGSS
mmetsp:Transcript_8596/g.35219  ORF Transcript_8596/g.35219 Transcript_8596/m.35219 type:complete len:221 (-) Transcript_8596:2-664(-)